MSRLEIPGGVPTGVYLPFAGPVSALPPGWLFCDGQAVSRTVYAALFAVLGTVYGVGDGSTTFNLPDLRGRSPVGANHSGLPNGASGSYSTRNEGATGGEESHASTTAENATHTHVENGSGSGSSSNSVSLGTSGNTASDNSTASSGSGTAHNTMHPFEVSNFIIRA